MRRASVARLGSSVNVDATRGSSARLRRPSAAAHVFGFLFAFLAANLAGCAAGGRPPQLEGGADLVYPVQARAAGVEGRVVVRYDITREGRVVNAAVVSAEPTGVFEEAALAAVRSWRFRPAVARGEAVAALGRRSEVTFRIGDDARYDKPPAPAGAADSGADSGPVNRAR